MAASLGRYVLDDVLGSGGVHCGAGVAGVRVAAADLPGAGLDEASAGDGFGWGAGRAYDASVKVKHENTITIGNSAAIGTGAVSNTGSLNNVIVGHNALSEIHTATGNIIIGNEATYSGFGGTLYDTIVIGNSAVRDAGSFC